MGFCDFGSWMSALKCLFNFPDSIQNLKGQTEVLTKDVRPDICLDVRGISGPKTYSLGLWFVFELNLGIPPAPHRSLTGPSGPESPKSLRKSLRGLPAPGSKKCPRQSQKSLRSLKKDCLSRKGFCRNPRGIFPNKVPGEFCGGFFGG